MRMFKQRSHYWLRSIPIFAQYVFVLTEPPGGGVYSYAGLLDALQKVGVQFVSLTFNERVWTATFWAEGVYDDGNWSRGDLEALTHVSFVSFLRRFDDGR